MKEILLVSRTFLQNTEAATFGAITTARSWNSHEGRGLNNIGTEKNANLIEMLRIMAEYVADLTENQPCKKNLIRLRSGTSMGFLRVYLF